MLGFGVVGGLVAKLVNGPDYYALHNLLLLGLYIGPVAGLASGLARWVKSPGSNDPSRTPTSTYRGSRNLMLLSVLVAPLICVLIFGLCGLAGAYEIRRGLVPGLVIGALFGMEVGPGREPAWVGLFVTSRWLAFRGKLPWNLMGFLDDAHRLGLLRTAGSVYQFRHAELQDHLAKAGETAARPHPGGAWRRWVVTAGDSTY